MIEAEKRVKKLKKRKYYLDKSVHGGHTYKKLVEAVKRIKSFKKNFQPKHLEEIAIDAGTIPSEVYFEYFQQLSKGLAKLNNKQLEERAKKFGLSHQTLSDWQYRMKKDEEFIPSTFESALKRDELKADLYDRMSGKARPSQASLYLELRKKHGMSSEWFDIRFHEMFTDPHTSVFLRKNYPEYFEKKPRKKAELGKATKEKLFGRLDEVEGIVGGLFDEDSNPKGMSTLNKALRKKGEPANLESIFTKVKRDNAHLSEKWRTFDHALIEWKKSRKKQL